MHSCINLFHAFIERSRQIKNFVNITGMKKTKSYKFKEVDLVSLRELGLKVKNPTGFRLQYGGLLTVLRTNVEGKLVHTLVQFYDPVFHCFTFSSVRSFYYANACDYFIMFVCLIFIKIFKFEHINGNYWYFVL